MIYKGMATDLLSVTLIHAREWPLESSCNSLKRMLLLISKRPGEAPKGTMETRRANSFHGKPLITRALFCLDACGLFVHKCAHVMRTQGGVLFGDGRFRFAEGQGWVGAGECVGAGGIAGEAAW